MKDDVHYRRIACREHSVPKPDPDQQEKDIPGGFWIVEFAVHMDKVFFYPRQFSYRSCKFP
jgi:hypothetical protein